ncbi:hypothetical protein N9L89_04350 [Gammaproteobacteria bacterium]|nr:hypothetical protein [Gammaproteobacteria bacterium]
MKTSVSKLLANRANAQKSSGPRSQNGKRASAKNAYKHGLAGSDSTAGNSPAPLDAELVNDARSLGYSHEDALILADALQTSRSVISAKHAAYVEKPAEERMPYMSRELIEETIVGMVSPKERLSKRDRDYMVNLLYKEVEKDNDPVQRLMLKIEAHRKLMRYEQRAVNRLRGAAKGHK